MLSDLQAQAYSFAHVAGLAPAAAASTGRRCSLKRSSILAAASPPSSPSSSDGQPTGGPSSGSVQLLPSAGLLRNLSFCSFWLQVGEGDRFMPLLCMREVGTLRGWPLCPSAPHALFTLPACRMGPSLPSSFLSMRLNTSDGTALPASLHEGGGSTEGAGPPWTKGGTGQTLTRAVVFIPRLRYSIRSR